MSGDDAAMLGELLCARLCHDLAGAIGAVGTGVELLSEDGDGDGQSFAAEALSLLAASAVAAVSRLKFLRAALGNAGGAVSTDQLRQLIADFLRSQMDGPGALRLDWKGAGRSDWSGDEAKLVLNIIMIARDCLPRGGVVTVEAPSKGASLPLVTAQGACATEVEAIKALQATTVTGLKPRGAQGYYTRLLAGRLGLSISYEDSHGQVQFVTTKN
ncbi:MAG TPA: histidine phosphotransferase family protein [Telmatospirillum sp.]|nr:histidine phosphotransferase family protein [Telmatospirillum sp.]